MIGAGYLTNESRLDSPVPGDDHQPSRRAVISIRANTRQRELIDQAAHAVNKTRSAFIREAALREAEQTVLDQTLFRLDDGAFAQFTAILDSPHAPTPALRELLKVKAPWD